VRRVAVISDVHSNLEALEAVMAAAGGEVFCCLGDMVGYGANPNEVLERLKEAGATAVKGNHDDAAVTGETGWFNARAAMAIRWTKERLTQENLAYLGSLPLGIRSELEGVKTFMTHGSPDDPLREYVDPSTHLDLFPHYLMKTESNVIALGHTHVPYLWEGEGGSVFNPGSVGQPRDGDPRASYAILTVEGTRVTVSHRRVEYDVAAAARKIVDAGLPAVLAERLLVGR
jgi:putative phosphoesterase